MFSLSWNWRWILWMMFLPNCSCHNADTDWPAGSPLIIRFFEPPTKVRLKEHILYLSLSICRSTSDVNLFKSNQSPILQTNDKNDQLHHQQMRSSWFWVYYGSLWSPVSMNSRKVVHWYGAFTIIPRSHWARCNWISIMPGWKKKELLNLLNKKQRLQSIIVYHRSYIRDPDELLQKQRQSTARATAALNCCAFKNLTNDSNFEKNSCGIFEGKCFPYTIFRIGRVLVSKYVR